MSFKSTKEVATEIEGVARLLIGRLTITEKDIIKYDITFNGERESAEKINKMVPRFALSVSDLPRRIRFGVEKVIKERSFGLYDIVIPSKGMFKGIPLSVWKIGGSKTGCGFVYKDGVTVGYRFLVPTSDIF